MKRQLRTREVALVWAVLMASWVVSLGAEEGLNVSLSHLSTLYVPTVEADGTRRLSYATDTVEQIALHPASKIIYAVGNNVIHVINASDVSNLTSKDTVRVKDLELTDVEVCGDALFVSYRNNSDRRQGGVRAYGTYNSSLSGGEDSLPLLHDIPLGSLADMLKSTPNCTLVVALENEAFAQGGQFYDPPGGVGIVRFPSGVSAEPVVTVLNFTKFDAQFEQLSESGVRWVFRENGNNFSDNVEPEYVAFNGDYSKAYVSLQENNAIAVVDLVTDNITDIYGLGFKAWGDLDPSDKDGGIHIAPWPVLGIYQPDGIHWVRWNGQDYLITANEGDSQEYWGTVSFTEEIRGKGIADADIAGNVSSSLRQELQNNTQLGRLTFSNVDGKNSEGKFEQFYTYGGRSISIWRTSDMAQVFDSGSQLEQEHAKQRPDIFNSNAAADDLLADSVDARSDNKGPEPESVTTGEAEGHLLIFAGFERPGSVAVFSVAPGGMSPQFQTLFAGGIPPNQGNSTWRQLYDQRLLYGIDPEDLHFVPASQGLADFPVLLMAGSYSGTISVLKVDVVPPSSGGTSGAARCVGTSPAVWLLPSLLLLLLLQWSVSLRVL